MHQGNKAIWNSPRLLLLLLLWNITTSIKRSDNIIRQYFIHQWHFQIETAILENRRVCCKGIRL